VALIKIVCSSVFDYEIIFVNRSYRGNTTAISNVLKIIIKKSNLHEQYADSYIISGILEQDFSRWQISIGLDIARRQLLQTSNLQRKHDLTANTLKARTERLKWTEPNGFEIVSYEIINAQAVMHYSKHRLTALVAYVSIVTYASANNQWARPVCLLVSSSKTKPCQFSSVQISYVALYTKLNSHSVSQSYNIATTHDRLTGR